ncbi:MAG: DegT/DnrJ/EryC1/StrS family aminotransferase [Theionarchaea archaeon]|nr:DegT/DnrJ/EryC1/StrS family aminotransferase [Theionarchaea archaeon]MBU7036769.1 DegT/DnrJ/EryC1/StrS family aminotransferase [Theionarchaea archaeon]
MRLLPAHAPPHTALELIHALSLVGKERGHVRDLFETEVKEFLNTDSYMTVATGRRALYLGLKILAIDKGSEVIIPAFTTNIIPMVLAECGIRPVPADVESRTYTLDPESVAKRITSETRAILTDHVFGYPSEIGWLKDLCEDHDLFLVEDAASAFGARYRGTPVGTFGDIGMFSFGYGKSISMGKGGGIVVHSSHDMMRLKSSCRGGRSSAPCLVRTLGAVVLANPLLYGLIGSALKEDLVQHQYMDYRIEIEDTRDLSLLSYALGIQQIRGRLFEVRRKIALTYMDILSRLDAVSVPSEKKEIHAVYTWFFVKTEDEDSRNRICARMRRLGIEPALPRFGFPVSKSFYAPRHASDIPVSRNLSKTLIGLPLRNPISASMLQAIFEVAD